MKKCIQCTLVNLMIVNSVAGWMGIQCTKGEIVKIQYANKVF